MKHYGDITKLNGAELPPVDVITGGSPCQDLSIAGQRKGLAGERSGLFMEQIRIIKEMRDESIRRLQSGGAAFDIRCVQPRYMVWENVPGAFSSNKGEDFRAVLEETAKIADENAIIPRPPKGKWTNSGCIMGDGWSIAWRVHDAQFWGVPQRRKRIALVADFGGKSAPEILFEPKGLSGDFEQGGTEREETAGAVGDCVEKTEPILLESNQNHATIQTNGISTALPASMGMGGGYVPMVCSKAISFQERAGKPGGGKGILIQNERIGALSTLNNQSVLCLNDQGGQQMSVSENQAGTLRAEEHGHQPLVYCLQRNGIDRADTAGCNGKGWRENESYTLNTIDRHAVYDARGNGDGNICPTITEDHENRITDYTAITYQQTTGTLSPGAHPGSYNGQDAYNDMLIAAVDCRNGTENHDINGTLLAKSTGGTGVDFNNVCRQGTVVRRLTPLECTRLQGYPDGWVDIGEWTDSKGKIHKDANSPKYKALGNSIALPFWQWMAERIVKHLKDCGFENPTMGSLFDGISGFPLVFARYGANPLWTSEIEEFPIAVCKAHFGDEDAEIEGDIEKYL